MRVLLLSLLSALFMATSAGAQDRIALLQDCAPLTDCLALIESTLPERDNGRIFEDEAQVAALLKSRFGRAARNALLEKAVGEHGGWRNYAGGVLMYWRDWSEDDVPLLSKALELDPGGSIAHVLAEIGSEEAIKALMSDLVRSGSHTQTGWALFQLGPEVLDYALPALSRPSYEDLPEDAPYTEGWMRVAALIGQFGSRATIMADKWIAIANNRRAPVSDRIAALRGLGAMTGYLGDKSASLHRLLRNRNAEIAEQAYKTLVRTYDPTVARRFAATCKPSGAKWSEWALQSKICLIQLADFGSNARDAGDLILPFLDAPNKAEQLYSIEALGLIGYEPAIPKIEPFLDSPDWRFVYASVRALSQLKSKSSVSKIEAATRNHWLWELRNYASRSVSLMIRNQPYSEFFVHPLGMIFSGFGVYSAPYEPGADCPWKVWEYRGGQLTFDKAQYPSEIRISLPDGELVGTDKGEFGGDLVWRPNDGPETVLVDDNTLQIIPVEGGYISIHGLSHMSTSYGFAVLIKRDQNGAFSAEEIARFPAAAFQVIRLDADLFAANAGGRAIIFSTDGIKEALFCDMSAQPEDDE